MPIIQCYICADVSVHIDKHRMEEIDKKCLFICCKECAERLDMTHETAEESGYRIYKMK